jgi:DNA (cytosine-5)-methyltransferase 1
VPQVRQRALIIASRVGKIKFPSSTHAESDTSPLAAKLPWVTVAEALSDLPEPPLGTIDKLGNGPLGLYKDSGSKYSKKLRSRHNFPYNHVTRNYGESVLSIIKNMRIGETWDEASERMRIKFEKKLLTEKTEFETVEQCRKRLIDSGDICEAFYKKYYWSAYTRLDPNSPALTITANANFLGSGRFTHPERDRGITMREAARLQSFHDDFTFITSANGCDLTTNIGIGLDMIGEAVPPLLAEAIATEAISTLLAKIKE